MAKNGLLNRLQRRLLLLAGTLARLLTLGYFVAPAGFSPVFNSRFGVTLVIVADSALCVVPFGALPVPGDPEGTPLVVRREVLAIPSASTLVVRVASPDVYRASGVEYNAALAGARATLARRADGRPYLRVTGERVVQEPFVDVILELTWNTGRLVREYTLLIDPPTTRTAQQAAPAPATPAR